MARRLHLYGAINASLGLKYMKSQIHACSALLTDFDVLQKLYVFNVYNCVCFQEYFPYDFNIYFSLTVIDLPFLSLYLSFSLIAFQNLNHRDGELVLKYNLLRQIVLSTRCMIASQQNL